MARIIFSMLALFALCLSVRAACTASTTYPIVPYVRCFTCLSFCHPGQCCKFRVDWDTKNCNGASVTVPNHGCNQIVSPQLGTLNPPTLIPAGYNTAFFSTTFNSLAGVADYTITTSAGSATAHFERTSSGTFVNTFFAANGCAGTTNSSALVCPP